MTRRAFFGVMTAAVAGVVAARMLPNTPSPVIYSGIDLGSKDAVVIARKLYRSNGQGVYHLIATINDNTTRTWTDGQITISDIPLVNGDKISRVTPQGETVPLSISVRK